MISEEKNKEIRTFPQPSCYLCGSPGKILYQDLTDRLFSVPGKWNIKQCLNKKCGLLWLNPMPLKEDIGKFYLDYYTHSDVDNVSKSLSRRLIDFVKFGYLARRYDYRLDFVNIWQKIFGWLIYFDLGLKSEIDFEVMYLKAKPQGRLLDVGCGSGEFLMFMQKLGWRVEGTEIDQKAVEIARSNKLQVRLGELLGQKYAEKSFDVVALNGVIEHIYNPLDILKECKRILKDSGFLMIITPNAKSRIHTVYKDKWFDLDPPRHLYLFSPSALKNLNQKAGFKDIDIWTTSRNFRSSFIGSWNIKRKGYHKMGDHQHLFIKIKAKFLQLVEEIILRINPDTGEEIVLRAKNYK